MGVISKELAIKEVEKWLDSKKVKPGKREEKKDSIETIALALMEGDLVLNEDMTITQTLLFPILNELPIKELKFKPRINTQTISLYLQGVKTGDFLGMVAAYICALTGQPKAVVQALDTEDYATAQAIAGFFL